MDSQAMFLDCPAYLEDDEAVRCGLPAEVDARYAIRSTDGPLESARIKCPRGHWFNGPIESLTMAEQPAAGTGISSRARSGPWLAAATLQRRHRRAVIAALVPPAPPGSRKLLEPGEASGRSESTAGLRAQPEPDESACHHLDTDPHVAAKIFGIARRVLAITCARPAWARRAISHGDAVAAVPPASDVVGSNMAGGW